LILSKTASWKWIFKRCKSFFWR